MHLNTTELAEIVSTRTCHDLIGNIGTLKNVLEFVDADGTVDSDTKNLLNNVSFLLNARQKFFRVAFGMTTQAQDIEELLKICTDYLSTIGSHGSTISFNLVGGSVQLSKIICLCVMIAADIFIRNGSIKVDINKHNITINAITDFKFNETEIADYQKILQNEKPTGNLSQYAQLLYLQQILDADVPIKMTAGTGEMTIVIG